jgi:UrcA family protein
MNHTTFQIESARDKVISGGSADAVGQPVEGNPSTEVKQQHNQREHSIMNTFIKTTTLGGLMFLSLGAALTCNAGTSPFDQTPSRRVRFADLNLAHAEGAQVLYRRIRNAAFNVCDQVISPANGPSSISLGQCIRDTVDAAVKEVNAPMLTAVHEKRVGEMIAGR